MHRHTHVHTQTRYCLSCLCYNTHPCVLYILLWFVLETIAWMMLNLLYPFETNTANCYLSGISLCLYVVSMSVSVPLYLCFVAEPVRVVIASRVRRLIVSRGFSYCFTCGTNVVTITCHYTPEFQGNHNLCAGRGAIELNRIRAKFTSITDTVLGVPRRCLYQEIEHMGLGLKSFTE